MLRYGTLRFPDSETASARFTVSGHRVTLTPVRPATYEVLARLLNADDPILLEEDRASGWRGYIQVFELPSPGVRSLRTNMRIAEVLAPGSP